MPLSSGFFNSVDHDRLYDADQFSAFLDGIVYDGIYSAVGDQMRVINDTETPLGVIVGTGRAWFKHTWTLNDTVYGLNLPDADLLKDRIDAVVLEINKEDRENYIKVVEGIPSDEPERPELAGRVNPTSDTMIFQYALAYVARPAASTTVTSEQIVDVVGSAETPFCSALSLAGIPSGGSIGQILAKESAESGAVGWYNVTNLPAENWWLPTGVSPSNVLGVYRFKGAESEAEALKDLYSRDDRILTKSGTNVTWSPANGFYIPATQGAGLQNSTIRNLSIGTVAIKFGNASVADDKSMCVFAKSNTYCLFLGVRHLLYPGGNAQVSSINKYSVLYNGTYYYTTSVDRQTDGIITANFMNENKMTFNGVNCALSTHSPKAWTRYETTAPNLFGQINSGGINNVNPSWASFNIHAAVIYNRILTMTEISSLTSMMQNL